MFKVNNRNTKTNCEICSRFIRTALEHISVLQLLLGVQFGNLNMYFQTGLNLTSYEFICKSNIYRPFGNLGIGISASASALTSVLASALQKFYFVLRNHYFCLSKFYIKKTSMVKYFSRTLADLPGGFSRCLE